MVTENYDLSASKQDTVSRNVSRDRFYEYYAEVSQTPDTQQRFARLRNMLVRVIEAAKLNTRKLHIADIGCGAGTQALLWSELGHHVHGIDTNAPLLDLARKRAANAGYDIDLRTGFAEKLPWPDMSMDICLAIELLEHVPEWKKSLNEFARILRPGGILCLTTTNVLCPIQHEFRLPFYSWYPAALKRYCEHLAVTTRPALANHAKYPAVNWFSYFGLAAFLHKLGFRTLDRFDVLEAKSKSFLSKTIITAIRKINVLRWCAHVATVGTLVVAIKEVDLPS
ncbi:methyltransferase domain-containing protein [bacterium]|nr:methyltransferase domain-containing protein [bacterium]